MIFPPARRAPERTLLVIGGGVAGASVCFFAARQGFGVTLIDAGVGQASEVPSVLLDPLRGRTGQLDARALEGLRFTWALIRTLDAAGHRVPHGQTGVLRPLDSDLARQKVERGLGAGVPHRWLSVTEFPGILAPGWPHRLLLPEGGWVDGAALVAGLRAASGADVRSARAVAWDAGSATLSDGSVLRADAVVWCGGSVGASWGGHPGLRHGPTHTHRGGSVLRLDRAPAVALNAGAYLVPATVGGVLGATFEAPAPTYVPGGPPLKSLHWLLERAAALSGDLSPAVGGLWSGSRLTTERIGAQAGGWWALAGLGSKGFLLGPLLAQALVREMTDRTLCGRS